MFATDPEWISALDGNAQYMSTRPHALLVGCVTSACGGLHLEMVAFVSNERQNNSNFRFHLAIQFMKHFLPLIRAPFFFQVNAQVLVSTFCKESQPLIRLGEAMGAVLQSCAASHKPISSVRITTQGTESLSKQFFV